MLKLTTQSGLPLVEALKRIFNEVKLRLDRNSGRLISNSLAKTTKQHISNKYPNSKHYSPSKVKTAGYSGSEGTVDVDIPGITRAFHNLNITPKKAQYLTIPIHSSAYGKKATDFNDLFKPKGKNILAKNENGQLVAMFALAKKAFQHQDRTLLPSDETYCGNIMKALTPMIDTQVRDTITTL